MAGNLVFDRKLIRIRQRRALALGPATFLLERVAGDLVDRLSLVMRKFAQAADIGTPGDTLRTLIARDKLAGAITQVWSPSNDDAAGEADEEMLPLAPGSIDLAVSALALQFANDLPGTLIQIRRALKPDGLFIAAMLGGETLHELREAFSAAEIEIEGGVSPRVAPFVEVRDAGALLQRAGFALPVTDVDRLTVRYDSVLTLLQELRRMGATNALIERRRAPLKRATLFRMAEIYAERFSDADGRLRASFDVVWLSGWTPHESQQKPLKPGSAKARLADALGTIEIPSGEKPKS